MLYSLSDKFHSAIEIYLDPNVVVIAVAIKVATMGFFDFPCVGKKI
jgi:hypothetical protein